MPWLQLAHQSQNEHNNEETHEHNGDNGEPTCLEATFGKGNDEHFESQKHKEDCILDLVNVEPAQC